MIKEKKTLAESLPEAEGRDVATELQEPAVITEPEEVEGNALAEMYRAVKRVVLTIREREDDPTSPPLFRTVAIDNGQFSRITLRDNLETEIAFPAIFIHYTNVRYLVQQQRIEEGRATMRVRFILNTLNNRDAERECDPFYVFQRVNRAIQDAKSTEPALGERCRLLYFDMPTTSDMLQAYWIDYEVWFRETSAWRYRDWVKRYVVMPPFTDHSDAPARDIAAHGSHPAPTDRQAIAIQPSVGGKDPEKSKD